MKTKIIAILTGCILTHNVCSATTCLVTSSVHDSADCTNTYSSTPLFDDNNMNCKTTGYYYVGCYNSSYKPSSSSVSTIARPPVQTLPGDCGMATQWLRIAPSCTACNTGYKLTTRNKSYDITADVTSVCGSTCTDGYGSTTYYVCEKCTQTCSSTTSWSTVKTGYEKRTVCNNGCGTVEYRCAAGYYGASTNGSSGCTICPSSGGVAGKSVAGSNTEITSCYIPANTPLSDSTGTYQYTSDCYYSK